VLRPFRRQDGEPDGSGADAAVAYADPPAPAPLAPAPASLALTPEQVRSTPEYRTLERELHGERSARGRSDAELERVRGAAESQRQAAEAERAVTQREQIRAILGDEGVSEWEAIAELSGSDPVAAATRMRDFGARLAQSPSAPSAQPAPVATTTPAGGTTVPPLPPAGALGGNAPLGQPVDLSGWDDVIAERTATFNEVVERNQNPATRNRLTMRDRARGIMAYVEGAYAQAFKNADRPNRPSR
jgi:hypothetical protein